MHFLTLIAWLTTWTILAYGPAAMLFHLIDYWVMRRFSPNVPRFSDFFWHHLGSVLIVAIFNPIICVVVVGQIYVALGFSSIDGFEGSIDQRLAYWLMSAALPLQMHYTVNATRVRDMESGLIKPRWMSLVWTATTVASVVIAWVLLTSWRPELGVFFWQ